MRRLRARAILRAKSAADQLSYRSADPVPHRTSPLPRRPKLQLAGRITAARTRAGTTPTGSPALPRSTRPGDPAHRRQK
jgi:hypothetical protein